MGMQYSRAGMFSLQVKTLMFQSHERWGNGVQSHAQSPTPCSIGKDKHRVGVCVAGIDGRRIGNGASKRVDGYDFSVRA